MKSFLFTVFDNKTQVFCPPFVAITQSAALRDFAYAANDKSTSVGKYPTDFTLYLIGEFDDETALVTETQMRNLGTASTFLNLNATPEELEHV